MAEQRKDNSGVLFKNQAKASENQPDYTGSCVVNGKELRMAAWLKKSQAGNTFMSFAFSEPQAPREEAKSNGYQKQSLNEYPEDDIPF